jgi:hypothetical protein
VRVFEYGLIARDRRALGAGRLTHHLNESGIVIEHAFDYRSGVRRTSPGISARPGTTGADEVAAVLEIERDRTVGRNEMLADVEV